MILRKKAIEFAEKALILLNKRFVKNPDYGVYVHAGEKLKTMIEQLTTGKLLPTFGREWVDIGLMAVRELEGPDPEFANALMDA